MPRVLLTGGAGYIGSHTAVVLLEAGYDVVIVDNLANSSREAVRRVEELAGQALSFHEVDVRDPAALDTVFGHQRVDAVVHFAGLKAVGESVAQPVRYYENNLVSTLRLLEVMDAHDVRRLVFSSSATVYGDTKEMPITEATPIHTVNPYGRTKAMIEEIVADVVAADDRWRAINLRYFNPVGAHPSGRIGEDPLGRPNNLMPFVMQVAVGRHPELVVFGDDYPTPDGTCVRDYIHVMDLAEGHVAALRHLDDRPGCRSINLGTGRGQSVREVIDAASEAVGRPVPFRVGPRRAGDAPVSYADVSLAHRELGWRAERSLADMCGDAWRWQSQNPNGYADTP